MSTSITGTATIRFSAESEADAEELEKRIGAEIREHVPRLVDEPMGEEYRFTNVETNVESVEQQ